MLPRNKANRPVRSVRFWDEGKERVAPVSPPHTDAQAVEMMKKIVYAPIVDQERLAVQGKMPLPPTPEELTKIESKQSCCCVVM